MSMNTQKKLLGFTVVWILLFSLSSGQERMPDGVDYKPDKGEGISISAENLELSALIKIISIQEEVNIISSGQLTGVTTGTTGASSALSSSAFITR